MQENSSLNKIKLHFQNVMNGGLNKPEDNANRLIVSGFITSFLALTSATFYPIIYEKLGLNINLLVSLSSMIMPIILGAVEVNRQRLILNKKLFHTKV